MNVGSKTELEFQLAPAGPVPQSAPCGAKKKIVVEGSKWCQQVFQVSSDFLGP